MLKVLSVTFQTSVTQRHRGANNQPHGSQLHLPSCLLLPALKRRTSCFWLYFTKAFLSFCRERSKIREAFLETLSLCLLWRDGAFFLSRAIKLPDDSPQVSQWAQPPSLLLVVFPQCLQYVARLARAVINASFRTSFSRSSLDHGCIHLFLKSLFLNARWCNNAQYSPLAC